MRKTIALTLAAFLFAVFPLLPAISQQVSYEVRVQTGAIDKAGTDANIYITLINENSASSQEIALNNPSKNDFERGQLDTFILRVPGNLGPIKTIVIRSNNKGPNPGWYLDTVKVYYSPPNGTPDSRYPKEGNRNVTHFRYAGWIEGPNNLKKTLTCTDTISAGTSGTGGLGSTSSANVPSSVVAPTNMNASVLSSSSIRLQWKDNANNEEGFRIERSASASSGFAQIATVGANVTAYDNTGLAAGTWYYRARAYNAGNVSQYSNVASATVAGTTAARQLKIVNNITGSGGFVDVLQLRIGPYVLSAPSTEKLSPDNYSSSAYPGEAIAGNGGTRTYPIDSTKYQVFIGFGMWSWTSTSETIATQGYWSKKLFGVDPSNNKMIWVFCNLSLTHNSGIMTITLYYDAAGNMKAKVENQVFKITASYSDPITVHQ